MAPRISAVINTLNEEKNLPFALRSIQSWVDEIIVVDMHSTDRTAEIARKFGATVHFHSGPGFNYAPRAFAVNQASAEWVLIVDADELIPVALSQDLKRIANSDEADVVLLHRANHFLGAMIRHTGVGPEQDTQVRFFKQGFVVGSSIAHQDFTPVNGARIKTLPYSGDNAIVHFTYLDSRQFIEKLNRYTSIEAQQASERGERTTPVRAFLKATRHFLGRYIIWKGFQDGWRGFYISLLYTFYKIATDAKLQELNTVGSRDQIETSYRQKAEVILKAYADSSSSPISGIAPEPFQPIGEDRSAHS
jgi:glycosyltransferase involved in cell wall biosynthesis